ncbi:MAG: Coenzyme PQQ synthesis protein D [Euryarchaeota archaeon ADurb.BinA087]|nr:MAG: Coenzyme PQQ synthesis protein D [Euryarchaeota archaeon ADurb.BinA087]
MQELDMDARYIPSGNIVAREIEGELIIVPLVSGIGDIDDELFSVNETGKVIWDRLDGKTSLTQVVQLLADQYSVSRQEMEQDVRGFVGELLKRKMITDARASPASS